jgi:hypothetical protein
LIRAGRANSITQTPSAFVPRPGSTPPVWPKVVQRAIIIKSDEKEKEDDEIVLTAAFLNPIRNRQKTTLSGLLNSLGTQKKLAGLKSALSASNLRSLGLNETRGVEVLLLLNKWAGDGIGRTFTSWSAAVAAAAREYGSGQGSDSLPPSGGTNSSSSLTVEGPPGFADFFTAFGFACPGFQLSLSQHKSIASTAVNIHGETQGGSSASTKHLLLGGQRCYLWRFELRSILIAAAPCALLMGLSSVDLVLVVMGRIVAGSVQQGKCAIIGRALSDICPILMGLLTCRNSGRLSWAAWESIQHVFLEVFWGAQARNMVKVGRELGSALTLLRIDRNLSLAGSQLSRCLKKGGGSH